MSTVIVNPLPAAYGKYSSGATDVTSVSGVCKFMGCSVISLSTTLGLNSTATSMSVTLVEDASCDQFEEPEMPSLWSFSLPSGGVGAAIFIEDHKNTNNNLLKPNGFMPSNVPFNFCGICTNWQRTMLDTSAKTISVSLVDPREILTGVQCLLNGFALGQNINGGRRFSDVYNVIDIYGYYNYGMDSNRNEYGLEWSKIRQAIEASRIVLHGINFEFLFTGDTFLNAPSWYRIEDNVIDLMGLVQKVATDGGSDFVVVTRKMDNASAIVEFRGIRRISTDILSKQQINNFISQRNGIVDSAKLGAEFRNEPTSSIIVGGFRNSMYVALPTSYNQDIHVVAQNVKGGTLYYEEYNNFSEDIKVRLFGGQTTILQEDDDLGLEEVDLDLSDIKSGAIFPFWGFPHRDSYHPMIEPFLPLDHLVFDKDTDFFGRLKERIPNCLIGIKDFTVRRVKHQDMFLTGDGDPDDRPFGYLADYIIGTSQIPGYIKGLPLNTEILRAALVSDIAFFDTYYMYYPDIAEEMNFLTPNWTMVSGWIINSLTNLNPNPLQSPQVPDLRNFDILSILHQVGEPDQYFVHSGPLTNDDIRRLKENAVTKSTLNYFRQIIYEQVKQYALDHIGRRFIVCLPKSTIMDRIFQDLPVPTRTTKPEIEYIVDDRGYWETPPAAFSGLVEPSYPTYQSDEQEQIRDKFMTEDGRFSAMAIMSWKPSGNINFNSNSFNRAMFQDIPVSEFRPNAIASGNPDRVFISCSVSQLVRRPDLALVDLPCAVQFDPTDKYNTPKNINLASNRTYFDKNYTPNPDETANTGALLKKSGITNYIWRIFKTNSDLRGLIKFCADLNNVSGYYNYASQVVNIWTDKIYNYSENPFHFSTNTEFIMDLEGIAIPLTSNWVSYGPWYAANVLSAEAGAGVGTTSLGTTTFGISSGVYLTGTRGSLKVEVDPSLVPWNFDRHASGWWVALNAAGSERLNRTLCDVEYLDNASISVVGFPEFGAGDQLGYNSNLTSINVDFGIGGVKTTYSFSTYARKPGTFRKGDYDNISRARVDLREQLTDTQNINLRALALPDYGTNRFRG